MTTTHHRTEPTPAQIARRIASSEATADDFREAARRLADLAEKERTDADRRRGNPGAGPFTDLVAQLERQADEYAADADDLRSQFPGIDTSDENV